MSAPPCPALESVLALAARRVRRRRVAAGFLVAFGASGAVAFLLEFVRLGRAAVGDPPYGHAFAFGAGMAVLALGLAIAVWGAWSSLDEERTAREIDARLGLPDVAATALAVARGRVASPLAPFVLLQAAPALEAAAPQIDAAWASEPPLRAATRRVSWLSALLWVAALFLFAIDLLHAFDFGFGLLGRHGGRDTGIVAEHDPRIDRPVPAKRGGAPGGEAPREDSSPGGPTPREEPPPPKDAEEPDVRAKVRPARESFRETDAVLVVVSGTPTRELPEDLPLSVTIELDGKDAPTGTSIRLGPSAPLGAGEILDLRRIAPHAGRLQPGEHTVRAKLRDGRGTEYASEPAKFRVEGDPGDGRSGGAQKPEPKPQPRPEPPRTPRPPDAPPPPGERPDPRPNEEGLPPPPPKIPVGFDPKTVLPLFREGEEVAKKGPTVVLVPGGGPEPGEPRRAPLDEALPDAVRRAEEQVERGAVRPGDRDLVRRYFEELGRAPR